jgi:hypothetical protein
MSEMTDLVEKKVEKRVADDVLRGMAAIADELGLTLRQTHYGLAQRRIPAGRDGNTWIASRKVLREHFKRLAAGQAA